MPNKRDEFTPNTKRLMAERVAWRCSYPNCPQITVGPNSSNEGKSVNNGTAAHIHAAAENGPRYDPDMSSEERSDITNGIWMCKNHGSLIDADVSEYSADTLRKWKYNAESIASENLKISNNNYSNDSTTLLQIGFKIIFNAKWEGISSNEWQFKINEPIIGNLDSLIAYISLFQFGKSDSFVIVESQGDARVISGISLKNSILSLNVNNRIKSTNPNGLGRSFDLTSEGKWIEVIGVGTAISQLKNCLSSVKGEMVHNPEFGSLATDYYHKYKENIFLLSRLLKLEFIKLSLIPINGSIFTKNNIEEPPLQFVERFLEVIVESNKLVDNRLSVNVSLQWGNNEKWSEGVQIFIMDEDKYEEFKNYQVLPVNKISFDSLL